MFTYETYFLQFNMPALDFVELAMFKNLQN